MSLPNAVIDALIAAGCTAEQLAAAVKAANVADDARKESKRANNAERQRRFRQRHANDDVTHSNALRDVTDCDSVTSPALSRPLSPQTPHTPTHTHPEKQTRARKGTRLPVDWEPSALAGDAAQAVDGWPPGAKERELARFKDWAASATGPNAVKSDWQAAWRNWIRKAQDEGRYGRQQHSQPARQPLNDIARNVAASLEREAAARVGH